MITEKQLLIEAKQIILTQGWTKEAFIKINGMPSSKYADIIKYKTSHYEVCLEGAVLLAAARNGLEEQIEEINKSPFTNGALLSDTIEFLSQTIQSHYNGYDDIIVFNDEQESVEPILEVLELAIQSSIN